MNAEQRAANAALLKRLGVVVVGMFGFGFALVPFYEKICEVTGIRNVAKADVVGNTQVDTSRTVRVELDANTRNLPWQFQPREPVVTVHPGELKQVVYEVVNTTDRPVTGQAIPSYAPTNAAQYFRKLECFCFATQTLQPGERREMPVVFVIDGAVPADMPAIALSYTFFEVEGAARMGSANQDSKGLK
jgi:cytochrome c oxidase assembly protein subunit 11